MMEAMQLAMKAETYLNRLCVEIPSRRVGSQGNRDATAWFEETIAGFGFATTCPEFTCIDWHTEGVTLTAGQESFAAFSGPYSLGCQLEEQLLEATTIEELEEIETADQILMLRGAIAQEQLMPKNFPFYNPEQHQRIVRLLEQKQPAAVIAATSRNPELAGGQYPFPLIEDGDFDIPSVYMTDEEGEKLAEHVGEHVALTSRADRLPSTGYNVIGRKGGDPERRLVIVAHIDAKPGTPGAIDNAAGVTVLLLLAELLSDYAGELTVELVAFNGEDYYAAPGQIDYFRENADRLEEILLGINIDAAGYHQGKTAFSLYECPQAMAQTIRKAFKGQPDCIEGESWYQSDHSIFIQNGIPAVAVTSKQFMYLTTYVTHTEADRPEIVDGARLAHIALALRDVVETLADA